jgi:hypothetical protein
MRLKRLLSTIGLSVVIGASLVALEQSPAAAASCPDNNVDTSHTSGGGHTVNGGANMRTGPSANCGRVQWTPATDTLGYACWKPGQDGSWSYVIDVNTGRSGWIKDSLLEGNGAWWRCP